MQHFHFAVTTLAPTLDVLLPEGSQGGGGWAIGCHMLRCLVLLMATAVSEEEATDPMEEDDGADSAAGDDAAQLEVRSCREPGWCAVG